MAQSTITPAVRLFHPVLPTGSEKAGCVGDLSMGLPLLKKSMAVILVAGFLFLLYEYSDPSQSRSRVGDPDG